MKLIPLNRGMFAQVDDEDFDWLSTTTAWQAWKRPDGKFYVVGRRRGGRKVKESLRMHRLIMNAKPGHVIDHMDGDGLNNQRSNLRFCTLSENQWNSSAPTNNSSSYKGVNWDKRRKKWRTRIMKNRKETHLGYFDTPEQAAAAYNQAATSLHGRFARLNIISVGI